MSIIEKLYRAPFGRIMSLFANIIANTHRPFMVYGYKDKTSGQFRKWTRISSNVVIMSSNKLQIGDHVWVGHYSILDATEGLIIGEGCQIAAWVGIFTHGSENSIRLLGSNFIHIPHQKRMGYTRGSVKIGPYTFIGAGSIILPKVSIGSGCLIGTGSLINKDIPDHSIVVGAPGKIKGSTVDLDAKFFQDHDYSSTYYSADVAKIIKKRF